MYAKELIQCYEAGERDFKGTDADLEQANLANAQTRMTIFCNTTMPDGSVRDDGCIEEAGDEDLDDEQEEEV